LFGPNKFDRSPFGSVTFKRAGLVFSQPFFHARSCQADIIRSIRAAEHVNSNVQPLSSPFDKLRERIAGAE